MHELKFTVDFAWTLLT